MDIRTIKRNRRRREIKQNEEYIKKVTPEL